MATMVPLPAAAGTPVQALDARRGVVAVLCGDEVFTGSLADPDSWRRLGGGLVDVALRGDRLFTARGNEVVAVELATDRTVGRVGPTDAPLFGFGVSPDGRWVALGEYRTPSVWDVESGRRLAGRLWERDVLVWSWPDGERISTGNVARMARGLAFHGDVLVAGDDAGADGVGRRRAGAGVVAGLGRPLARGRRRRGAHDP